MIDFRYHLVSIVAVFLALAIGIVLGSTELQGPAYNFLNQHHREAAERARPGHQPAGHGPAAGQRGRAVRPGGRARGAARPADRPAAADRHRARRAVLGRQRDQHRRARRGRHRHRADRPAAEVLRHQRHHAGQPEPDHPGRGPDRQHHAGHQRDLPAAGRPGDRQRDPDHRQRDRRHQRSSGSQSAGATRAPTPGRCSRPTPRPSSSAPPGSRPRRPRSPSS